MNFFKPQNISNISIIAFVIKICILGNILSAFFLVLTEKLIDRENFQIQQVLSERVFWEVIFYVICIGLTLSIPTLLILGLVMKTFTNNRLILVVITLLLIIITFYCTGSMALKNSKFPIPLPPTIYSVVIALLILTVKLRRKCL